MSGHFRDVGKELGVTDPKSLEDVYKTHLENTRPSALADVDSARGNLAGTSVNMHYGEPVYPEIRAAGHRPRQRLQLPTPHPRHQSIATTTTWPYTIFAMELVGAGTNNARLAQMLRQLAGYYYKEPDCLFMVRIAQGLVHMGKGTIGLNPFFSDRSIMSRPAIVGLLATLTAFTDAKHFILDKYRWMLYFLVTAMYPRFLITVDEELNSSPVTVHVGQALARKIDRVVHVS
ncbi:hypothetical protein B0H14DRAFT_512879 [Mycena olivaceomarginata]|nr:hypothetical protein B0H14DRAFT_512879 [Mycena olivaceomarginata]